MNRLMLALMIVATAARSEVSWTLVSAPDWHIAERDIDRPIPSDQLKMQVRALKDMQQQRPDLVMIAGDTENGRWIGPQFIDKFSPGGTQADAIRKIGQLIYGNMKARFAEYGLAPMIVAVGDHELGDDSGWSPGSETSKMIPVYRDIFSKVWNTNIEGQFLYMENIGSVPCRPLGTPFENTSYAIRHKNLLIVTVDIFKYEGPDAELGEKKLSVAPIVDGEHLKWFDRVLAAGRTDPQIGHIVVQGHNPVLFPARAQMSSCEYVEGYEKSAFWQTMKKYRVDLYFGGEVHAPSVAMDDDEAFPVQVVHGGYCAKNYIVMKVSDKKLDLTLREFGGQEVNEIGSLEIDKSGSSPNVTFTGMLTPVDRTGLLIHYDFENTIWNGDAVPNLGGFDKYYSARMKNIQLVPGRLGMGLSLNGQQEAVACGMGMTGEDHPVTVTAWIKTEEKGSCYLVSQGLEFRKGGFFDLGLDEGALCVWISCDSRLQSNGPKVNDGRWHQVTAVLPAGGKVLGDVRLYVDGVLQKTSGKNLTEPINVNRAYSFAIGGPHTKPSETFKQLGIRKFTGVMDEVCGWSRGLTEDEIFSAYRDLEQSEPPQLTHEEKEGEENMKIQKAVVAGTLITSAVLADDIPLWFKKLDANGDLKITAEEWVSGNRAEVEKKSRKFDEKKCLSNMKQRDANADGIVTLEEFISK